MPEFTADTLDRALADLAADLGDPGAAPLDAVQRRLRSHRHRRRTALASSGALASALVVTGLVLSSSHSAGPPKAGSPITTITEQTASMENTISAGERVDVVADPVISRGDIIAFNPLLGCEETPATPCPWVTLPAEESSTGAGPTSTDMIKRVLAIGGDTISCPPVADNPSYCDKVVVNGHALEEPYVFENNHQVFGPVTVPAGQLYVLGDHRGDSSDSRYNGTLAVSSVIGRVTVP